MAEAASEQSESTKRREADYAATQSLKASHLQEFNALKQKEMAARGVDWKPKPTEKERKAAELAAILAEYPDLATTITGGPVQ